MEFRLACKDLGVRCKYSVNGISVNEVIRKIEKHAKEDHDLSEEDFENPKIMKELKKAIHIVV